MSRTYRRKNTYWEYWWVTTDCINLLYGVYTRVPKSKGELKKSLAKYHADRGENFRASAPRAYCKVRWHKMRQAANRELYKFKLDTEHEVQIHANHKHSAQWDYW
jgi:hypothetical protein